LKAFKAFDLDPCYLSEWRQLLGHLAYVLFPEPGAPRKWTDERLCKLLADVAPYKRKNPNRLTAPSATCSARNGRKIQRRCCAYCRMPATQSAMTCLRGPLTAC